MWLLYHHIFITVYLVMSVNLEINIARASKTFHPGEVVKGVVVVTSKSSLKVSYEVS